MLIAAAPAAADTPLQALQKQAAHTPPKSAPAAALLLQAFQDICLDRFPDAQAVKKAIADRHLAQAGKSERDQVTLGMTGEAWAIATPKGPFVLTLLQPPRQGCSIAGVVQAAPDINANFETMITHFAAAQSLGPVVRTAPHYGHVAGKTATAQLINVAPKGAARQAFVNLSVLNADTTTLVRMTRTVAAK